MGNDNLLLDDEEILELGLYNLVIGYLGYDLETFD